MNYVEAVFASRRLPPKAAVSAYRRHSFVEGIRNGGLDFVKAAVKLIWACQYVCCTTAFFFYRRPAVIFYIFLRTIISLYTESVDWIAIQSVYYRLSVLPD